MRPRAKCAQKEYPVGYKRPPEKNRFKKGVSGNPSGRPKKTLSFSDRIEKELLSRQIINVGGQRVSLSTEDVLIKSLIQHAIRGKNAKALDVVIGWIAEAQARRVRTASQETRNAKPEITREDLMNMTEAERNELYRKTLAEMNRKALYSD